MFKKIAFTSLGLLAIGMLVLGAWYQIDGQPLPETSQFLHGPEYSSRTGTDGSLVFSPAAPNGHGLLIMHGALIKPLSYAKTAAYFAARGYTVFVPSGAARLSVNAVDDAAVRMRTFGVRDWVMLGHSMGGLSSLTLIERHAPNVRAVALWACAMPADFSRLNVPMLFIWGDHDGLLPAARLADARSKLPASTRYVTLPGANHQGFAMYSHQFFDNPATIGWSEQIDFANAQTAAFFAAHLRGGT
jgi:pimeloyl-ACP methyl ester carboxylesterase